MVRAAPAKKRKQSEDRRHLVLEHADARLAGVQRFQRGEGLCLGVDGVGELQEQT